MPKQSSNIPMLSCTSVTYCSVHLRPSYWLYPKVKTKMVKAEPWDHATHPSKFELVHSWTSDFEKANCLNNLFYNSFNHWYPPLSQQVCTKPEDCLNAILCTEVLNSGLIVRNLPEQVKSQPGCQKHRSSPTKFESNLLIQTSSSWQCVVPIPKKGHLSSPWNHHSISILSLLSKLFRRHINYCIVSNHLNMHYQSLAGSGLFTL